MFHAFITAPIESRHCLPKAIFSLYPVTRHLYRLGCTFVFRLPAFVVRYFLSGGNRSFLRAIHKYAAGQNNSQLDQSTYLAGSLGPSSVETKTRTLERDGQKSQSYSSSVVLRAANQNSTYEATEYYRSNLLTGRWEKSIETVAALYDIELLQGSLRPRRQSSGAPLFDERYSGALKAPVTVVWGQRDPVLKQEFCLDGITDYLAKDSQVVMLPRTGHWTVTELEGRVAIQRVIEWAVQGEKVEDLDNVVKDVYDGAFVSVQK